MNNFKELEPKDKLPDHVKGETLSSLSTLKMIMDMVDLFVVKGSFTIGQSIAPGSAEAVARFERLNGERNSDK